jgi:hypothetical protein
VNGTIPEDLDAKKTCMKIACVFTCLAIRAKEDNEHIAFHLVENEVSIGIRRIHTTWTLMIMGSVTRWDSRQFDTIATFPITETIEVYAAYERVLRCACPVCLCEFTSEINRERCIQSHVNKKKPEVRCSRYPVDNLCDFWDTSSDTTRKALIKDAQKYLLGIPDDASFSPIVSAFFNVVQGDVSMPGRDLMIAMDLVSENTFLYNVKPTAVLIVHPTRGDYLASMAHEVTRNLAEAHAYDMSMALLDDDDDITPVNSTRSKKKKKMKTKKLKKTPVHKPHVDVVVSDVVVSDVVSDVVVSDVVVSDVIVFNVQRQKELEDQYAKDAYPNYIERLEKMIFSRPFVASNVCWADME